MQSARRLGGDIQFSMPFLLYAEWGNAIMKSLKVKGAYAFNMSEVEIGEDWNLFK